jgi:hypothetical protein
MIRLHLLQQNIFPNHYEHLSQILPILLYFTVRLKSFLPNSHIIVEDALILKLRLNLVILAPLDQRTDHRLPLKPLRPIPLTILSLQ